MTSAAIDPVRTLPRGAQGGDCDWLAGGRLGGPCDWFARTTHRPAGMGRAPAAGRFPFPPADAFAGAGRA